MPFSFCPIERPFSSAYKSFSREKFIWKHICRWSPLKCCGSNTHIAAGEAAIVEEFFPVSLSLENLHPKNYLSLLLIADIFMLAALSVAKWLPCWFFRSTRFVLALLIPVFHKDFLSFHWRFPSFSLPRLSWNLSNYCLNCGVDTKNASWETAKETNCRWQKMTNLFENPSGQGRNIFLGNNNSRLQSFLWYSWRSEGRYMWKVLKYDIIKKCPLKLT